MASCPGGVASNLVSYLAKADVPLSVAMTAMSTLAAVVMTPILTSLLVGALVPVDGLGLLLSTLQVPSCLPFPPCPCSMLSPTLHCRKGPGPVFFELSVAAANVSW